MAKLTMVQAINLALVQEMERDKSVLVLGEDEMAKGTVSVKDMPRELQYEVPRAELAKTLRVEIEQWAAMPKGLAS